MWSKIKSFLANHWLSLVLCVLLLLVLGYSLWLRRNSLHLDADVDIAVDAIMKNSTVQLPNTH